MIILDIIQWVIVALVGSWIIYELIKKWREPQIPVLKTPLRETLKEILFWLIKVGFWLYLGWFITFMIFNQTHERIVAAILLAVIVMFASNQKEFVDKNVR